ncbi:MAG: ROK family protein [Pyrinomonadaceae bacterium]
MSDTNNQTEKLVGVEISQSAFRAVCLEPGGNLQDVFHQEVSGNSETFGRLIDFIGNAADRFGGARRIGVAVPGLVNRRTRSLVFSTFFPELEKKDFTGELEAATGLGVLVENDANSAGYGEYRLGAGRGSRNMFYITLGTGVGGSLIIDQKIWHGATGFAGEFGHIAINSEGLKLEGVASAANIVRRTRNRFHQDHTSSLSRIEETEINLTDIVNAARNEDDFARMMLERTGRYIGTAVASVINLLNIEKIVVGGEIMRAENLVLDAITERAREISFAPSFETTRIVEGELGENATAIGVALLSAQ